MLLQVMSPMRKAAAGVTQLNTALQNLLNPSAHDKGELTLGRAVGSFEDSAPTILRQGDRVIQCSNNYQKDVFNGDIGFVSQVKRADRQLMVQFPGVHLLSSANASECTDKHTHCLCITSTDIFTCKNSIMHCWSKGLAQLRENRVLFACCEHCSVSSAKKAYMGKPLTNVLLPC